MATQEATGAAAPRRKTARDWNAELLYTMYAVFRGRPEASLLRDVGTSGQASAAAEADQLLAELGGKGVHTRGTYDVSGLRADADYLLWWTAREPDALQEAYARWRQTRLGRASEPVWSAAALHRPAEFNKGHVPAYVKDETPGRWVCVYPYVRSYEWYLLPAEERRAMLAEHGQLAREYPDVRSNTVAAFALGDYEWVLAFEADELHRIMDLMRHLRAARARLHTRAETPFYTGCRKPLAEIVAALP